MSQSDFDDERPSVGLRERNVEARRQRILQAARTLLARGGLGALSMRKLADEASLSVNTLYNLWGTREEILRALTQDAKSRIDALLPQADSADPIEYCRSLVRLTLRAMISDKELFQAMILAWLEGEIGGQPAPIQPMGQAIQVLSKAIRAARAKGLVECALGPEQVAWQIQHGAQFAAIQWALGRIDDAHFEARALYGLNLTLLGLVCDDRRPEVLTRLRGLERKIRASPPRVSQA